MASNWKIKRALEKQGLEEDNIKVFFQLLRSLQGRGENPGTKFQKLYAGKGGAVAYYYWQQLSREGYIR